jgi:PGF-pre-PGF domain-containing protein
MKKGKRLLYVIFLIFLSFILIIKTLPALSIVSSDYTLTNTSVQVHISFSENANMSINYGTTPDLGNSLSESGYSNSYNFELGALIPNTLYYWNILFCNNINECNTTGLFNLTTLPSNNDLIYPLFSDYLDNNGSLIDLGTVNVSVVVTNTNGSVMLNFGGQNFIATNNSGDPMRFNASVYAGAGGVYSYYWKAYGNGTSNNYNHSETRKYTINLSSSNITSPVIVIISPSNNSILNSSSLASFTFNVTNPNLITNCSLIIDGNLSRTDTSISRNISQIIYYQLPNSIYQWQINCTDSLGNKGSSSVYTLRVNYTTIYSVNNTNSSNNSSTQNTTSNLTSEAVPYSITKNISVITPDILAFSGEINSLFGVIGLYVEVNLEARNVSLFITRFDQKPSGVSSPETNNVYKYIEMHSENLEDKLNSLTINFTVPKNWTTSRGISKENVTLSHLNSSSMKWSEVQTTFLSEGSDSYTYSAKVNSFSYFYIGQKLSEDQKYASTSSFLTFLKKNFFWMIAVVLVLVLIFVLVQWLIAFNKRKNQAKAQSAPELKPWTPPEAPEGNLSPDNTSFEEAPSFENEIPSLDELEKKEDVPQTTNSEDYVPPIAEEPEKINHEDLKKEISGLKNQIDEKGKGYTFSDKK